MKVVVIIPSYNEKENVAEMIQALAKVFPTIKKHQMQVLYVDGNSPDGTANEIRKYQKKYSWLHLLVETKKEGLGMAYAKAMRYAMDKLKPDWLMEMDGDFQHPPADIPRLVAEIDHGYDYILGSRYVQGGSIPKEWSLERKFLSVVGNLVARVLLIVPQIHDVTGGFKLSKVRGFMDEFDFDKLLSRSFAYKIHLLFYMVQKGAKVKEVPFAFGNRTSGESKIIKNEMQETLRVIFKLQIKNPKIQRFLKFGVVGVIGLTIQTAFFELFGVFTNVFSPQVSTAIGGELAIISNFILNNIWTFREYKVIGIKVFLKFLQFNLSSLVALTIQFVILGIGQFVARGDKLIIQLFYFGAILIVLVVNFYIYNTFIWKTSKKEPNQ
jgi:dolichol-phosphate mannosyltransferase